MNPIYKFELSITGLRPIRAYPIYKDDLAKDFAKEAGQQFFRASLSGNLTFEKNDYTFIVSKAFDTQFFLDIFISYDAGATWASYWNGTFWKTDCEFDEDTETVVVKPSVLDQYTNVLAGIDKEYNLIDLAPEIVPIVADKRPMVQVYVPGQSVVGCVLSGMWWEQEAEPETNETKLVNDFHFALNKSLAVAELSGTFSPSLPDLFTKEFVRSKFDLSTQTTQEFTNGNYRLRYRNDGVSQVWQIYNDSTLLFQYVHSPQTTLPASFTLTAVSGSGATGSVNLYVRNIPVYCRFVCDTQSVLSVSTYPIPDNDIVPDNRNYSRIIGYDFPDSIIFSDRLSQTPTQWGIYQPGQYYQTPYSSVPVDFFPVARNQWGRISIWYTPSGLASYVEESGRQSFTIRNAFPLSSVISVLLSQIAPGVTHQANTDYSQFLYGTNLLNITQTLMITPKSNIVSADYDQPAQKAPITLKDVTDMLRDCFRCYWFIDAQNRFRIEHIQYFRNGGSYDVSPVVGIDLTQQTVTRNGKPWAFGRNQYKFNKPDMAGRYQFAWMDDVTQLFEGYPIDIISKYVNQQSIEQINVSKFTSDIDYILLNPSAVSKDGFVLFSCIMQLGNYTLPYYNFTDGTNDHILQNAYVAFCFLQQYYQFDMPAPNYSINGVQMVATGTKRLREQTLRFPGYTDPDLVQLVRTNIGNGTIEKMSVNLSSRNVNATLMYDTE